MVRCEDPLKWLCTILIVPCKILMKNHFLLNVFLKNHNVLMGFSDELIGSS